MGCITEAQAQPLVQLVLWIFEARGNVEAELDETGSADRDEQRLVGHCSLREVTKPCLDEVATGQ